jgi:GT2 family glycosyltransferase
MNKKIFNYVTIVLCAYYSSRKLKIIIPKINKKFNVLIIDNSKQYKYKNYFNKLYKNVKYHIPEKDSGLSASYNFALKTVKTPYIFITQPDVKFSNQTINYLFEAALKYSKAAILSSTVFNKKKEIVESFKSLKINKKNLINSEKNNNKFTYFNKKKKVIWGDFCPEAVNCTTMLVNKNFIKKIQGWDKNFFMYCEDIDLCLRARLAGFEIIKVFKSKVNHLGFNSHDQNDNKSFEDKRNWHWSWSQIYFNKKHKNKFNFFLLVTKLSILSFIKLFLYLIIFNKKYRMYFFRMYGSLMAFLGFSSFFRSKNN